MIYLAIKLLQYYYHWKGPNYIWHMDAYEKLVHYGFTIHGCMDGLVFIIIDVSSNNFKCSEGIHVNFCG